MRVVIADDSMLVREGIATFLRRADIDVAGQAASPEELLREVGGAPARRGDHRHPDAAELHRRRACARRMRSAPATRTSGS